MIHRTLPAALALAAALSACNQSAEAPTANAAGNEVADDAANTTNTAVANVALPPAIRATRTYRCTGDNSVIEVNFLADDVTANVRPGGEDTAAPTVLTAPSPGEPFVAEGYSLSGSGENVTYDSPTTEPQSCRAGPASS